MYLIHYICLLIQMIKLDASHLLWWCLIVLINEYVESTLDSGKANRTGGSIIRSNASVESSLFTAKPNRTANSITHENTVRNASHIPKLKKTPNKEIQSIPTMSETVKTSTLASTHSAKSSPVAQHFNMTDLPLFKKIHSTITRSKDAVWATISLTFICIVLLLAVAQSKMWKEKHPTELQGIPLPNFNERVPFKEVMQRKIAILRELVANKKKPVVASEETELESLLGDDESE